ncbi:MAG: amidohydrolase family protein, partial [Gemmatimonadota bacterium]
SARWLQMVRNLTRPLNRPELMRELDRRFAVATAADAERAVDSLARLGADFVKIRNYPAASAYFALVRAASARGMKVAGHAPPMSFIPTISDSGFASFEHVLLDSRNGQLVEGLSTLSGEARSDLARRLARNATAWTPTFVSGAVRLLTDTELARIVFDTTGARDSTLRFVPRALRDEWRTQLSMRSVDPDTSTDWAAIQRSSLGVLRDVAAAGVTILAGSDLSVPGLVPGFSLQRELEMMVQDGGISPREALASATVNAVQVLGLAESCGRVAPGYCAELVLLDRDPLIDISAVRSIRSVIARGRVYDRKALAALASPN